ncbi:MAG: squalene/phytoene synthase family protein [Steroidobacteraceae bacterium]
MSAPVQSGPRVLRASARDFAWLYSPPRGRAVLGALLDIEREVGAALRPGLEHTVAHVRLAWWREECERCAAGGPAHPATQALTAAADRPVDPRGFVDAATWDLAAATFATRSELAGYCERWGSAMMEIAAQSIATGDAAEREACARAGRALGAAVRESELLAGLAGDARAGRLRLPLDELERSGIEAAALARSPWTPALRGLIAVRCRDVRDAVAAGVAALPARRQPDLRGLVVWAALAHRAARGPHEAGRAGRMSDAWRAWRAARRADRGTFELMMENAID